MIFESKALPRFWERYNSLPEEVQRQADKQFEFFVQNPFHPSLHLKPVSVSWSVRVNDSYRALAIRVDNEFSWFWIGPHKEYDQLVKGR